MEYIVFDSTKKELYIRDTVTSFHNRLTLKVLSFYLQEHSFHFELDPSNVLRYKEIYYPKQNTVLSIL
jgi:hypothetical protein